MTRQVQLAHGGGGEEMEGLIRSLFFKYFNNDILLQAEDAATLHTGGKLAFSTDSFTVSPIFFNGGDIGKIAVAGSVNDVAMMGAKPLYMSCGFIIEEGLAYEKLERIVASMAEELEKSGCSVVCGDTKVVPKGGCDEIFINTAVIGELGDSALSASKIREDDLIIVSRDIGRHGACIMAQREGIEIETDLQSDCATLSNVTEALLEKDLDIKAFRDATRGGLAAVLNEWAQQSDICIELEERDIPVCDEVQGICEILGFEPTDFANEGTFVIAVDAADAQECLQTLQNFTECPDAAIIGKATTKHPRKVILQNAWGSGRFLEQPKGELLPRIC